MGSKQQAPMDAGRKGRMVLILGLVVVSLIASAAWIAAH